MNCLATLLSEYAFWYGILRCLSMAVFLVSKEHSFVPPTFNRFEPALAAEHTSASRAFWHGDTVAVLECHYAVNTVLSRGNTACLAPTLSIPHPTIPMSPSRPPTALLSLSPSLSCERLLGCHHPWMHVSSFISHEVCVIECAINARQQSGLCILIQRPINGIVRPLYPMCVLLVMSRLKMHNCR